LKYFGNETDLNY